MVSYTTWALHILLMDSFMFLQFVQFLPDYCGLRGTHGHRAYFPAFQQPNRYPSIPKMGFFYDLSPACRPKNAYGHSHLATRSHTLRTYLCIEPEQTSTRREHEKHNAGTTICTSKSGFLRTCVQLGQAADKMQATQ